jgi:osmotically-inducible protein OsmY
MNAPLSRAVAALIAAGSVSMVSAQVATNFAPGPIASAATTTGGDQAVVDAIVSALNSDQSLKDSKITVADDDGNVLLTGATQTRAQKDKIMQIATANAGDAKVVNTVLDSAT